MKEHLKFMQEAIRLSIENVETGNGGPFGCVIVKNGEIIARGQNQVLGNFDPTAHAEVQAIRIACKNLKSFQLDGCILYTSCEPCPMCLGAIYWARPDMVFFANSRIDAAEIGFDDDFIYQEIQLAMDNRKFKLHQIPNTDALLAFEAWQKKQDKIRY